MATKEDKMNQSISSYRKSNLTVTETENPNPKRLSLMQRPFVVVKRTSMIIENAANSEEFRKAVPIVTSNPHEKLTRFITNKSSFKGKREEFPVEAARVSTLALLSYSTVRERWLMAFGILMALVSGSSMPAWLVILAKALDKFNSLAVLITAIGGEGLMNMLMKELNDLVLAFVIVGIVSLISGGLYVSIWTYTGEKQVLRIKEAYVRSVFRQDAAWFDTNNREELPTIIATSMGRINDAIGRKMCDTISNVWAAFSCLGVAFWLNAPLAIVMLCVIPLVGIVVSVISVFIRRFSQKANKEFANAGALATEVISGIKTVASLTAESWAIKKYTTLVKNGQKNAILSGFYSGLASGMTGFMFYCTYSFAFWLGTLQVVENPFSFKCLFAECDYVSGAAVMTCIYGVILSATFFGLMAPGIQANNLGRQAAVVVFETIQRKPKIDPDSNQGITLEKVEGALEFQNVSFAYPSRSDKLILKKFNLKIEPGSSIALVGPSGSGKSTVSKLLLRFYDSTYGNILVDGTPLTSLNAKWWRSKVGYVAQEPTMFPGTIKQNIRSGKPTATDAEVISAAKAACAHEFITDFPEGYDTFYSGASIQMSGGQMQRICIARAVIRNPVILLLDEATSALDTNSERVVQEALENIRNLKKMTTVTVAHRLSTIISSDKIAVISDGTVEEIGNHRSLLEKCGIYATLCKTQGMTLDSISPAVVNKLHVVIAAKPNDDHPQDKRDIESGLDKKNASTIEMYYEGDSQVKEEVSLSRLWMHNKSELPYQILGILGALVVGALPPCEGIITAQLVSNFYILPPDQVMVTNTFLSQCFLILAAASLVGHIAIGCGFSVSGFRLTRRMRVLAFEAIIRHTIGWFDDPAHSTGELTSRLEEDAEAVSKVTGWALGYRVRVFATLISGVVVSLIFSWKIGLVALGCVPLIMAASLIQAYCTNRTTIEQDGLSPATLLEQGLRGISALQAYNLQNDACDDYSKSLEPEQKGKVKEGMVAGLVFGVSQFAIYTSFGILFYYGAQLLIQVEIDFATFFTSLLAVMFGAFGIAQVNADFNARQDGLAAAARIFRIVDDPLDNTDPFFEGGDMPKSVQGDISFRSVNFNYSTRPNHPVYYPSKNRDGFSLDIAQKESVAFVGKSGCGKSTALQLFLRFYDADSGEITLDNHRVDRLNIGWLRQHIGYVGQQPVLFSGTVRSNILLGKELATDEEIISAAKAANAHDFIMKLGGYDTNIGTGGSLLSGGQKQRVAIARAIIKNPEILVLDEATAALDNESEKVVQVALSDLQKKQPRTTLIVAHRLITVKECNKIAVLDGGGVKELGSHEQLLEEKGLYHELWMKQCAMEDH